MWNEVEEGERMTTAIERGTELLRAIDEVLENPNHQPSTERLRQIQVDRRNGVVDVSDPLARLVDLNARHRDERMEDYMVDPAASSRRQRLFYGGGIRSGRWVTNQAQSIAREQVAVAAAARRNEAEATWNNVSYDELVRGITPSIPSISDLYRQHLSDAWTNGGPIEDRAASAERSTHLKVDAPSRDVLVRTRIAVKQSSPTVREALAIEAEDLLGYTPLRDDVKAPSALRRVLAHLEIDVLDEKTVDAYKKQMVAHYDTHGKMKMPTWRLAAIENYALPIPEFVLRKAVAIKKELPAARFYVDHLAIDPFLIVSMEQDDMEDPNTNLASRHLDANTEAYIECWDEPKFEGKL
jgi:hypothetical protein